MTDQILPQTKPDKKTENVEITPERVEELVAQVQESTHMGTILLNIYERFSHDFTESELSVLEICIEQLCPGALKQPHKGEPEPTSQQYDNIPDTLLTEDEGSLDDLTVQDLEEIYNKRG